MPRRCCSLLFPPSTLNLKPYTLNLKQVLLHSFMFSKIPPDFLSPADAIGRGDESSERGGGEGGGVRGGGEKERERGGGGDLSANLLCVEQLGSPVVPVDAANLEMADDRDSFADPVFLLQQV